MMSAFSWRRCDPFIGESVEVWRGWLHGLGIAAGAAAVLLRRVWRRAGKKKKLVVEDRK